MSEHGLVVDEDLVKLMERFANLLKTTPEPSMSAQERLTLRSLRHLQRIGVPALWTPPEDLTTMSAQQKLRYRIYLLEKQRYDRMKALQL